MAEKNRAVNNNLTSKVNHTLEEKGKNKQLWEKNEDGYVYIPYEISNAAYEDPEQEIVKAIKEFTDKTFIRQVRKCIFYKTIFPVKSLNAKFC